MRASKIIIKGLVSKWLTVFCLLSIVHQLTAQDYAITLNDSVTYKKCEVVSMDKEDFLNHVICLSNTSRSSEVEIRVLAFNDDGKDMYNFDISNDTTHVIIAYNADDNTVKVDENPSFKYDPDDLSFMEIAEEPELEIEDWMLAPFNITSEEIEEKPLKLEGWMLDSDEWALAK